MKRGGAGAFSQSLLSCIIPVWGVGAGGGKANPPRPQTKQLQSPFKHVMCPLENPWAQPLWRGLSHFKLLIRVCEERKNPDMSIWLIFLIDLDCPTGH